MSEPATSERLASGPREAAIMNEKELLTALGMTESDAASALGRSRQSLYQAGLGDRRDYFKKNDLVALLFAARARAPALDLSEVYDYLGRTRSAALVAELRSVSGAEGTEATLSRYHEVWAILPDLVYLRQSHPEAMALLLSLAGRPGGATRFLTANDQDAQLLRRLLPSSTDVRVDVDTWMSAFPYSVIGEPSREADYFVFAGGRFLKHDWYGGPKLALLIDALSRKEPLVRG